MKNFSKVIILFLACLTTWLTTSAIVAQYFPAGIAPRRSNSSTASKSARQSSVLPITTAIRSTTAIQRVNTHVAQNSAAKLEIGPDEIMKVSFRNFDVAYTDNAIIVNAGLNIFDKRSNASYFWMLNIQRISDEIEIFSNAYINQTFRVNQNSITQPTFRELIPVDLGGYRVELSLVEIIDGISYNHMNDPEKMRNFQVVRKIRKIVVQ